MARRKKADEDAQVIIIWYQNGYINSFGYNSGNGPTRVYWKDRYDARLGEGLPYFRDLKEAQKHCFLNPGINGCAQLDIRAAKPLKFELAEVA